MAFQAPAPTDDNEMITRAALALLAARGLEKESLMFALGIGRGTIYRKFNGKSEWKASEVAVLARFFNVPVANFYDGLGGLIPMQSGTKPTDYVPLKWAA